MHDVNDHRFYLDTANAECESRKNPDHVAHQGQHRWFLEHYQLSRRILLFAASDTVEENDTSLRKFSPK
jgi:hypothetical protein